MQQLISFFYRNKNFLFFFLLEGIALFFTFQSHTYHKSKFVNSANAITGTIYQKVSNFKDYLLLKEENNRLAEENVYLKNLLEKNGGLSGQGNELKMDSIFVSDSLVEQKYFFYSAKVINNEYNKSNNYLTINIGSNSGIGPDMAVINQKGIIGITKIVSGNYATVLSVLNVSANINVKLKNSDHFGTLSWDTKDYRKVQLLDLPIQANIKIGDTIVTGGKSLIFPEGIPVGTILDFERVNSIYTRVDLNLFNDMSAVGYVEIIRNFDKEEIQRLEEQSANE
jgi:rod shape-determining protein MreC